MQEADAFPELPRSGQRPVFRWMESGEHDEARDSHVGRSAGDLEAVISCEGAERVDGLPGDMPFGRVVRPRSGEAGEIPDPESGDRIEGETLAQAVSVIEAAVFDAGTDLQGVEETFDSPAQFVPATPSPPLPAGSRQPAGSHARTAPRASAVRVRVPPLHAPTNHSTVSEET